MVELWLHESQLNKRKKTHKLIAADSIVRWLILFALGVLLLWYFFEIVVDLRLTQRFQSLCWMFGLLALLVSASAIIKLLEPDPSNVDSSLRLGRAILGIAVLNALTAILAIDVARALNPDYDFQTPLLRFTERLLHQFST